MPSCESDKQDILVRPGRMKGQLKGIQRTVEKDTGCVGVLNQIASILAAVQNTAGIIPGDHICGYSAAP
jgi:CsoR family transcriptional regulator, copper-sensing transcriptional repressor